MNPILKIENVSKQYRLGVVGTGTLSHDLNRWWHTVRGKEDPYLKIGETNDRAVKGDSQYVWALKDISFEVQPGEVLGIIGKNGAGKSTLLKILSQVTGPTTGTIKSRGRIASLLEVGTGFHPELTGKENIYLNGAILGMTKAEIKSKFDEIVEFAGVSRYIDTPVKRYSSGMKVRLAFAVAAHLEPEILVVDEVLAVGDAEFQKKAIGKMQDIAKGEGRTVLFVSHNMAAVKQLCTRGIVLEDGGVGFDGGVEEAIDYYLRYNDNRKNELEFVNEDKTKYLDYLKIDTQSRVLTSGDELLFKFKLNKFNQFSSLAIHIGIYNRDDEKIVNLASNYFTDHLMLNNQGQGMCEISKLPLLHGDYYVNIGLFDGKDLKEHYKECLKFSVLNGDYYENERLPVNSTALILVNHSFYTI